MSVLFCLALLGLGDIGRSCSIDKTAACCFEHTHPEPRVSERLQTLLPKVKAVVQATEHICATPFVRTRIQCGRSCDAKKSVVRRKLQTTDMLEFNAPMFSANFFS